LFSSPQIILSRGAGVRLLALAMAFPLVMLALSPAIAVLIHLRGVAQYRGQYRLIAQAVERAWLNQTIWPTASFSISPANRRLSALSGPNGRPGWMNGGLREKDWPWCARK
jgi:hypothetical protein